MECGENYTEMAYIIQNIFTIWSSHKVSHPSSLVCSSWIIPMQTILYWCMFDVTRFGIDDSYQSMNIKILIAYTAHTLCYSIWFVFGSVEEPTDCIIRLTLNLVCYWFCNKSCETDYLERNRRKLPILISCLNRTHQKSRREKWSQIVQINRKTIRNHFFLPFRAAHHETPPFPIQIFLRISMAFHYANKWYLFGIRRSNFYYLLSSWCISS